MTIKEILIMQPGEKLDRLVGKEIAGLDEEYFYEFGVPCYSADILVTWQMVEKIRTIDTYIEISNGWQPEQFWWVKLTPEGINAWGRTLPEAICKAALLAKLENKK